MAGDVFVFYCNGDKHGKHARPVLARGQRNERFFSIFQKHSEA